MKSPSYSSSSKAQMFSWSSSIYHSAEEIFAFSGDSHAPFFLLTDVTLKVFSLVFQDCLLYKCFVSRVQ